MLFLRLDRFHYPQEPDVLESLMASRRFSITSRRSRFPRFAATLISCSCWTTSFIGRMPHSFARFSFLFFPAFYHATVQLFLWLPFVSTSRTLHGHFTDTSRTLHGHRYGHFPFPFTRFILCFLFSAIHSVTLSFSCRTQRSLHPKDSTIPNVLAVIEAKTRRGSLLHAYLALHTPHGHGHGHEHFASRLPFLSDISITLFY